MSPRRRTGSTAAPETSTLSVVDPAAARDLRVLGVRAEETLEYTPEERRHVRRRSWALLRQLAGPVKGMLWLTVVLVVVSNAARAAVPAPSEPARMDAVAEKLRVHALDDVARTDRDQRAALYAARMAQIVDYVFGLVYALLGVRFVLSLVGARSGAGFTRFIEAMTDPVYAPFRNIVDTVRLGDGRVVLSIAIAFLAYGLLHFAIRGVLKVIATRRTTV